MYKILKNIIEMDDYSVQKLSNLQPPEPFEWNTVEGTELNVSDCIGGKGKIEVGGNTEQQTYEGKNLLNPNILENGALNNVGEKTNTLFNQRVRSSTKQSISAGIYTISTDEFQVVVYRFNSKNTLYSVDKDQSWKNTPYTFTLDEDGYINIAFKKSDNSNITPSDILAQIEKGSQATSYEPYVGGQASPNPDYPQEIKRVTGDNKILYTGKNLLNSRKYLPNENREKYIQFEDGVFTVIQASYNKQSWIYSGLKLNAKKFNNGFTFFAIVEGTHNYGNLIFKDEKGNNISGELDIKTANAKKVFRKRFTTTTLNSITWFDPRNTVGTTYRFFILEGDVSTSDAEFIKYAGKEFELNLGNIELCKIGDYKDVLFKNEQSSEYYNSSLVDNAWYKKETISRIDFDGTEDVGIPSTTVGEGLIAFRISLGTKIASDYCLALSNRFLFSARNLDEWNNGEKDIAYTAVIATANNKSAVYCRVKEDFISSVEEMKQYLAENETYVYLVRSSPTYTPIADETLITQLEALNKAKWFKGVNHWWTETNNLEPVLKGTYRQAINE